MFTRSIRNRLTLYLLSTIIVVGFATIFFSYRDTTHEVNELFDAQLAQSARILHAQIANELKHNEARSLQGLLHEATKFTIPYENNEELDEFGHEYERKIGFQVWDRNKKLTLHSESVGTKPLSTDALIPGNTGFSTTKKNGQDWRVFSLWDEDENYVVQAGESLDIRQELVRNISGRLISPSLISIPLLALLIWLGITRGLKPIHRVVREVQQRESDSLNPIQLEQIPQEIIPLTQSLNDLFYRLNLAFQKERQFTNDAAHELRTPLAALKTHAQVALRETDEEKKEIAIRNILDGVKRASHLIDQMLILARMSPEQDSQSTEKILIFNVAEEVAAELSHLAVAKNIDLALSGERHLVVHGQSMLLAILLRNLIHNAINYTNRDGEIKIELLQENNQPVIQVTDTGPGIDESLIDRVFDRFFRVTGNHSDGCGLGLAIAKECAHKLKATLHLTSNIPHGLIVRVVFNASAPK